MANKKRVGEATGGIAPITARVGRAGRGASKMIAMVEELESRVLLSHSGMGVRVASAAGTVGSGRAFTNVVVKKNSARTASPSGFTPAMVRQAYGINQISFGNVAGDGAGQTIAIVDAFAAPTLASDLHLFDQQFGLPDAVLTQINERGGAVLPGTDPAGRGNSWAMETALDVEWAHVAAPGARIVLVEASSDSDSDLAAALNTARNFAGVSVVSISWGTTETSSDLANNASYTTPAGHIGETFVVSSGDNGAFDSGMSAKNVDYPASSPNVIAVGGTSLTTDASGNYVSESGWGDGTRSGIDGGSGGGLSVYQSQLAYQKGIVTQSTTKRAVPDVAMLGDPGTGVAVIDSWDSPTDPWMVIGGTSLAAPMWAGLIAIADQGRAVSGTATLSGTQALSAIYAAPGTDFHDVTTGNNGYAAGPGFDLVTGRGTPLADQLVPFIAGTSTTNTTTAAVAPTIGSMTVSPVSVLSGGSVTLVAGNVVEVGGTVSAVNFYRESDGVGGLQIGSDTLIGAGVKSGNNWTIPTSTVGLSAGAYTYYAVATDSVGVSSGASSAALKVTPPPPANDAFAAGIRLAGTSATATGSNVNATRQTGEPVIVHTAGGKSVWWVWTAPASGKVTLNTHGSSFDTLLGVYTGLAVSKLTTIAGNDDAGNRTLTSALTFNAVAGRTYRIVVDGYKGASGNISLNLVEAAGTTAVRRA